MGELHLDIKVDILRRTYKVDANIGAPQVAYREKLARRCVIDEIHKKQTGGSGQFARVKIIFEPNEPGKGSSFESQTSSAARCRRNMFPASRRASTASWGPVVSPGFPFVDVKATLARRRLSRRRFLGPCLRDCARASGVPPRPLKECGSVLLEPIMKVEVTTPEDYTGSVMGDLLGRRGQVQGQDMSRGNAVVINAMVPLANMFGYATNQLADPSAKAAPITQCNSIIMNRSRRAKPGRF